MENREKDYALSLHIIFECNLEAILESFSNYFALLYYC